MSDTPNIGFPLLEQAQAQKEVTVNESLVILDALLGGVISQTETTPPGSPSEGDAYIIPVSATGVWTGHAEDIAYFFGGVWNFLPPSVGRGHEVWVEEDGIFVQWSGGSPSGWIPANAGDASAVSYTPAVPADWDGGVDPGAVNDGLDQLAERVTDLEGAGAGTVTSVDASGGVQTASGSAITTTGTVRGAHVINAQTGTSYALIASDRGKHVTLSNASSIAVTIAQAGGTGFEDGYFTVVENIGVGAVTITPATSTINGTSTLVLDSGMSTTIFSDGTNYRAIVVERAGVVVNAQTGTSYTYLSGDRGKLVTHTNAAAIAGTLPQATTVFGSGWFMWVENRGAGTLTITPTTSTIDGAASLALTTNQGCLIASDGTNYFTMRGIGGSGGGSLTNFTEAVNTSAPNATIPVTSLTATNAATNVDAAYVAKGTGAHLAQIPDNGTGGGNKRGAYANDWQKERSANTQVASGDYSTVGGGRRNTASNTYATVGGGSANTASNTQATVGGGVNNTASAQSSTIAGGSANTATNTGATVAGGLTNAATAIGATVTGGQNNTADGGNSTAMGEYAIARGISGIVAHACGLLANPGDSQRRNFILRSDTSNATPEQVTTTNAAASTSNIIVLPNASAYAFRGHLIVRENATGDTKGIEFKGAIKRGANAAATALLGSVTQADLGTPDAGSSAWTVGFTADTTNGGLAITVTGEAAHSLKWVAHVHTVEVVG